jgi:hypothetical protein
MTMMGMTLKIYLEKQNKMNREEEKMKNNKKVHFHIHF